MTETLVCKVVFKRDGWESITYATSMYCPLDNGIRRVVVMELKNNQEQEAWVYPCDIIKDCFFVGE